MIGHARPFSGLNQVSYEEGDQWRRILYSPGGWRQHRYVGVAYGNALVRPLWNIPSLISQESNHSSSRAYVLLIVLAPVAP